MQDLMQLNFHSEIRKWYFPFTINHVYISNKLFIEKLNEKMILNLFCLWKVKSKKILLLTGCRGIKGIGVIDKTHIANEYNHIYKNNKIIKIIK
jgi:hypothetical protein